MSVQYYEGIGRRKESRARVRLMGGSGKFTVNQKEAAQYFTRLGDLDDILQTFKACGQEAGQYDLSVTVTGGGVTGQTGAVRLGLARRCDQWRLDPVAQAWSSPAMPASRRKKPGLKRPQGADHTKR
jgi:small subunit ribosomal protein S9